ncbi:MAG: hypothetical protein JXD22_14480 [Sedimentisphaerales bacterium]|nr:hypothetical protein [Sedimentisphaerales bacterium]
MPTFKVLITVKTYPVPSKTYDELVCTAGVTEEGDFIRLYPINFRDLPYSKQYQKYQWIQFDAEKHASDPRKESFRPNENTLITIGKPIPTNKGNWSERSKIVLAKKSASLEELYEKQKLDNTSLGIFRPREVFDLEIKPDNPEWKPSALAELKQQRIWENRSKSLEPPRKMPWKFIYHFSCDDARCKNNHKMQIIDWEIGALYWNLIDKGTLPDEAAQLVKQKFFEEIFATTRNSYFFVGTVSHYPTWIIIGTFWPLKLTMEPTLFNLDW